MLDMDGWSTALPDWEDRILARDPRQSLIPPGLPLFPLQADFAR